MAQPQQMQQQNIQQSMDSRPMDHDEKKMRRQIANSNERRRMQSINAGFQSLRQLLPHHEGEKLSKVSLLRSFFYNNECPRPIPLRKKSEATIWVAIIERCALQSYINLQFPCTQLAIYGIRLNQLPGSWGRLAIVQNNQYNLLSN